MSHLGSSEKKLTIATVSLAGCFGCHMSFLDLDEKIFELVQFVEFHKSPLDDIKSFEKICDVGLVEGGCCNSDNVKVLREFRKNCKILISVGQCAITGGLPAMRNGIPISELMNEAYRDGITVHNHLVPNDEEIPVILDRVYPCHEIVKVDAYLPGCAPRSGLFAEAIWAIKNGQSLDFLSYENFKYD